MQKRKLNDSELISDIKNGNTKTIEAFYAENYPTVLSYVKRKGGHHEDAKDVMQEGMYGLLIALQRSDFVLRTKLGAYFFSICKNKWINRIRETKDDQQLKQDLMHMPDLNDDQTSMQFEEHHSILFFRKMQLLKKECREIIGFYLQRMAFKTIAEKMNLKSEGAARTRKKACLDKLLEYIKNDKTIKYPENER